MVVPPAARGVFVPSIAWVSYLQPLGDLVRALEGLCTPQENRQI
jgi:hypothetical protein